MATQYTRDMLYSEYTADVLRNTAPEILKEQRSRVKTYLNRRTGAIENSLTAQIAHVQKNAGGATLTFDYLVYLRFLDMKRSKSGKKKRVYGPVYNRPLWGFVYGYIFGQLRYGLTDAVRQNIFNRIRESYKQPL